MRRLLFLNKKNQSITNSNDQTNSPQLFDPIVEISYGTYHASFQEDGEAEMCENNFQSSSDHAD